MDNDYLQTIKIHLEICVKIYENEMTKLKKIFQFT
jgi:hypothetical protein